ncbi:Asp-tRNA(Asn)/Glu-tRNA(Gln) amidotransferase GatCAB subunit A [Azoarcus sp. DD4]|uniref:amidase n=1 Tax=Azoarcus sp. DD4 TaxID=2027405 RepID=UPI00112D7042|nr:amidase [Azoarcus sp. DD4]QDF97338.1 Asp-tRNA(Asn)/Glu-tRNA(Gln) amidotransferase GatCAB subunit A [Azoarcus sp. DD4]
MNGKVGGLHDLELAEVATLLRERAVSPVELTRHMFGRIRALDGRLHAYARLMEDEALQTATQAEAEIAAGRYRGPLHGVPVAVKDLFWTRGTVTAAGTTVFADFVPDEDATVVRRLREAGAVILGKLQMTEGAFATHHPTLVPPVNPWGAEHWTGASSSGSGVATAAGLCFAALGTDTGGSIRFPAAANGLSGLKPGWGRVSRHGVFALAPTLDHVGPMARSVRDVALVYAAIAGHDGLDPTSLPDLPASPARADIAGLRVGVDPAWNARGSDAEVLAGCARMLDALAEQGAEIVELALPESWHIAGAWELLCGVQTAVAHARTYPARAAEYGPALARLIDVGRAADAMTYHRAQLDALDYTGRMDEALARIDLLLAPVQPFAAPTHERLAELAQSPELNQRLIQYTAPINVSGHPSLVLPCGLTAGGMPLGCQLIARKGGEATLLRAGAAVQAVTAWHRTHPPL